MNIVAKVACSVIFLTLLIGTGMAEPPANVSPDPALHAWFESLRQPVTRQPCCSISDCRFSSFEVRNGHYEVKIEDWPYVVPDEVVLHMIENPFGKAVVCYGKDGPAPPERTLQDPLRIFCFIPPKPTS